MSINRKKVDADEEDRLLLNEDPQDNYELDGNQKNICANNGPVNNITSLHGDLSNTVTFITSDADQKCLPICFGYFLPYKSFTGRTEELISLKDATINQNVPAHSPRTVVVSGLGGVGKTQLVRKFIDENRLYYTNIIWINSNVYSSIFSEFTELAKKYLKMPTKSNGKDKDFESLIKEVFNKLSEAPTIIVLDNVDETKTTEIIKILVNMGTSGITRPHVVITSRIQEWSDDIHRIQLQVFSEKEALQYVSKKLTDKNNLRNDSEEDKIELVKRLQYFPLALAQATAYINHHRVNDHFPINNVNNIFPIDNYIREYENVRDKEMILDSKFFQNECNVDQHTTFTTWRVTIAGIKKYEGETGELALRILRIIAYFDPDNIHRDIFYNLTSPLTEQKTDVKTKVRSAVRILINYSMIDGHTFQSVLSVHRLVQQVTRIELEINSDEKRVILKDSLHIISEMEHHVDFKKCLEHGISVFLATLTCLELAREYKTFPEMIVRNLNENHKFVRAMDFGDKVVKQMKTLLGEDDVETLKMMFSTTNSYYFFGKYFRALEMYEEILEMCKTHLDPFSHKLAISCKMNIANTYTKLGRDYDSLLMKQQVLDEEISTLDEDNEDILYAMFNIGVSYSRLGKYNDALLINHKVFKRLKSNNRFTLKVESNIGCMLSNLGRYSEALPIVEGVFQKRTTDLEKDHPEILNSMSHIANIYNLMGKYSDAFRIYEDVFNKRKTLLKEDHPKTLDSKSNMATSIYKLGKYFEALKIHQEVFDKQLALLGENHLSTIHSSSNIAKSNSKLGKYNEALLMHKSVFDKRKTILGDDHPLTIYSLSKIGICYGNLGEHSKAAEIHQKVFERHEAILGEDHPDTLTFRFNIAVSYNNTGEHYTAVRIHENVLEKRKTILRNDHPDTLKSMANIANSYKDMGDIEKALTFYREVLEKRKVVLGNDHPDTILSEEFINSCEKDKTSKWCCIVM